MQYSFWYRDAFALRNIICAKKKHAMGNTRKLFYIRVVSPVASRSSEAADLINASLQSFAGEPKNAIKEGNAVFVFTVKTSAGEIDSWHIDLKK